jgi:hypothetical protein
LRPTKVNLAALPWPDSTDQTTPTPQDITVHSKSQRVLEVSFSDGAHSASRSS